MESIGAGNRAWEEVEDVGADVDAKKHENSPARLSIEANTKVKRTTATNAFIKAPKSRHAKILQYRSIFGTGASFGTLSSTVRNDRDAFRGSRTNKTVNLNSTRFIPYASIKDLRLRVRLMKVADYIEYLDRGFAEYFQAVGGSANLEATEILLQRARQSVRQRKPSDCLYIGELGEFCESLLKTWKCPNQATKWVHYRPRPRNDQDKIEYLQDALEIPYWQLMIDSFMKWRQSNVHHMAANGVLYVLNHITTTCRRKIRNIHTEALKLSPQEQEGIRAVIEGVEQRLKLFDRVLIGTTIDFEDLDDNIPNEQLKTRGSSGPAPGESIRSKSNETSILISLVFVFIIPSLVFFAKGFAISSKENRTGSVDDADFWYLCQSNTMSILGNLAVAIPLLKHHRAEHARAMFWLSFSVGLAMAIISIVIYVPFNTGYSALVAYLGSIASAWSLLALTQATTQEAESKGMKKVKEE
ncbi:hypothetical protein F5Y10DRAFT_286424 [Nemania abortiva]|nr:hypothetical protein F5Y10DRAFT_286424 [Nemania abortiva]